MCTTLPLHHRQAISTIRPNRSRIVRLELEIEHGREARCIRQARGLREADAVVIVGQLRDPVNGIQRHACIGIEIAGDAVAMMDVPALGQWNFKPLAGRSIGGWPR